MRRSSPFGGETQRAHLVNAEKGAAEPDRRQAAPRSVRRGASPVLARRSVWCRNPTRHASARSIPPWPRRARQAPARACRVDARRRKAGTGRPRSSGARARFSPMPMTTAGSVRFRSRTGFRAGCRRAWHRQAECRSAISAAACRRDAGSGGERADRVMRRHARQQRKLQRRGERNARTQQQAGVQIAGRRCPAPARRGRARPPGDAAQTQRPPSSPAACEAERLGVGEIDALVGNQSR